MAFLARYRSSVLAITVGAFAFLIVSCGSDDPANDTTGSEPSPSATPVGLTADQLLAFVEPDDQFELSVLDLEPESHATFETLLSRLPDNITTRANTRMADSRGVAEALGYEPLKPGYTADELKEYFETISSGSNTGSLLNGFSPPTLQWPIDMRQFADSINLFPDLGFDMASADSFAATGSFFLGGELPFAGETRRSYDVALGSFDPGATQKALAECDCPQPEIREFEGTEYYAWSDGTGKQSLRDRLGRPFFDNLGRGPHLLIQPGEAYYSVYDGVMDEHISVLNGTATSLADIPGYVETVESIAGMGIISEITFSNYGKTVEEALAFGCCAETPEQVVQGVDLLLPYEFLATGVGFDGTDTFIALALVHSDSNSLSPNIERLLNRIRNTAPVMQGDHEAPPLADLISRIQFAAQDRILIAKIDFVEKQNQWPEFYTRTLLVHE